jgi:diacylglycerol diphosphate phosphatase/phosphatidate phosphatase
MRLMNGCRFLAGQMHVFRPRTDLARVLLALSPLIGAALIAISRLEDYRHDVYDVTVGSTLGLLVAYFSYSRYYPGLKSPRCDTPHPSHAEWALKKGHGKRKDEEARIDGLESFSEDTMESDADHVPLRDTSRERARFVGSSSGF